MEVKSFITSQVILEGDTDSRTNIEEVRLRLRETRGSQVLVYHSETIFNKESFDKWKMKTNVIRHETLLVCDICVDVQRSWSVLLTTTRP